MAEEQTKPVEITVEASEEAAAGVFANVATINHSEGEFAVDFLYVQPTRPVASLKSRVITTPQHVKRLLRALGESLSAYEEKYGEVVLGEDRVPYQ